VIALPCAKDGPAGAGGRFHAEGLGIVGDAGTAARRRAIARSFEHVRLPDGREIEDYLQFAAPSYAVIVAQTQEAALSANASTSTAREKSSSRLPAGSIEQGEEPMAGAQRELLEETGYASDDWQLLGRWVIYGNARGGTANAFLARGCRKIAEPASGDLEKMSIELKTPDELLKALLAGELALLPDAAGVLRALLALGFLVPA